MVRGEAMGWVDRQKGGKGGSMTPTRALRRAECEKYGLCANCASGIVTGVS